MTQLSRRSLLGIGACLIAAPAIVRASSLMEVRAIPGLSVTAQDSADCFVRYTEVWRRFGEGWARDLEIGGFVQVTQHDTLPFIVRAPTPKTVDNIVSVRQSGYMLRSEADRIMPWRNYPIPAAPSLAAGKSSAPTSFDALRTITLPEVIA